MPIPVVLKNGAEQAVSKDEFQFLLVTRQVLFFERAEGWAVVGRDRMRSDKRSFQGDERRTPSHFTKKTWY